MALLSIVLIVAGLAALVLILPRLSSHLWSSKLDPYFPDNPARNAYLGAQSTEQTSEHMRGLLIRRAMEAIRRFGTLSDEKHSIMSLKSQGALSSSIYKSFEAAETETMDELFQIKCEAESLHEGWSKTIIQETARYLQTANRQRIANH